MANGTATLNNTDLQDGEMTLGDALSLPQSTPSEDGEMTLEQAMGQSIPTESFVTPVPEEHKGGFISNLGKVFYAGMMKGSSSFNELIGLGVFKKSRELFVTPGLQTAEKTRQETYTKNKPLQFVNDLVESFGNMGVTLPIDIMSGGMTKTALAGKVLPEIEVILSRIPDFALGSGWRGLVEGIGASKGPIEGVVGGIVGAGENIAINTLYGNAGVGFKGIGTMAALGAANATYDAVKEGRPPSKDELINGSAQGAAYGIVFSILPHLKEATKIGAEKIALGKYETELNTHIKNGDLPKVQETVDKMMVDEAIRPQIKEALGKALEQPTETPVTEIEPIKIDKFEGIYQKLVNRFQSIENTVTKARELGAVIKPGEDAGLSAERYLSIGNQAKNTIEQGTFKITKEGSIQMTGEGLKPIIDNYDKISPEKNIDVRDQELTDYLIAKRTVEDLQRPKSEFNQENIATPEQVKEAQADLEIIKNKYGGDIKHLEETASRLYDYQKRVLNLLVDSGNMSQEMYDSILAKNPNYVPFDRILPTEEVVSGTPISKNRFTGARSPIKKIKGSELEIHNPIESMVKNTYKIMDIASRNKVWNDIYSLKEIPEIGIKEIQAPIVPVAKVKVKAAIDAGYLQQVKEFAEKLGAKVKTGGQVGRTLGTYSPAGKVVERKFATPEEVVSHEVGHFLDGKYKLKENFYKRGESKKVGEEIYQFMVDQGQSANRVKKVSERFAHAFEWWLSNRALAKEDLPLFTQKIEGIISEIPELAPLLKIRPTPGLTIESRQETIFAPSQFKPKGNVLEGYINGKRTYMEVSKNLYDAMTGLNETSSNMLVKILSKPAQWLRMGATTTPEFILRNPIRDQWTALLQTHLGWKPFIDTGSAIADILKKDDVYNDWIRSGGSYAGFVELSRPNLKKMVDELNNKPNLLANLNILTKLGDLSQLMEQGTRLGVYKAGVEKGLSAIEAAKQSREATVDFARRGSSTRDINATIAFFNAGIQGLDKTIRNAKKDPIGMTIKATAAITIPSILLYLKNRQDPDYKEQPRWQKDLFWMTKIGDTWVRIPKPFLYGQIFGSLPERLMEYIDTKDPQAFNKYGESLYNALSPISGDPMSGLLPTAVRPIIENLTNYNFFRGRAIVSEGKQRLLPSEQYSKYDTETSKLLGKILNVSPSKIENLVQGYTGGMGRYALQTGDLGLKIVQLAQGQELPAKKPIELSDIPLIKGFVSRDMTSGQSESVQQFYDNRDKVSRLYNTYKNFIKTGDRERANKLRQDNPEMRYSRRFNQVAERFTEIEKQVDKIVASKVLNNKEKQERIKILELRKVGLAKRTNELLR